MSTATFADWLAAISVTPITPEKMRCVTEKNEAVRGGNTPFTPFTPFTPKNIQGQIESAQTPQHESSTVGLQGFKDPSHAVLMALAMAYCDRTGASDKARQDWQRDIADTPPELRVDLHDYLNANLLALPRHATCQTPHDRSGARLLAG